MHDSARISGDFSHPGQWVDALLRALPDLTVSVFGDFCLDAYWQLDETAEELSLETALPVWRVRNQRYSLGGAGNVVANLAAMGVGHVRAIGALGDDLFAGELRRLCANAQVDTAGLITHPEIHTLTYAKPYTGQREHNRLDFGAFNRYPDALVDHLLQQLDRALAQSDAVILNQQIPGSLSQPAVIARINAIFAAHSNTLCLVDSRHFAASYAGAVIKVNLQEAALLLGDTGAPDPATAPHLARRIFQRSGMPVFLTRGQHGLVAIDANGTAFEVSCIAVDGPVDTVGAGDSVIAALAAALSAGASALHAAHFANIVANITIQQLQCTGTASPQQIRSFVAQLAEG